MQEVVWKGADIDLAKLPIQTCWPGEPAPLITWPLVVTKGPSTDREDDYNLGIYRMQVLGPDRTVMRWLAHRGGAQHHRRWKAEGKREPLPACAVIGADPGTILAAVTPVPDTLSEYQFAGLLRGAKVELVPAKTVPLMVPANAEIVIEGHVLLDDYADEGPYGDHTGFYNSVEKFPVFQVSAITMRKDPIYLTTFTGRPPDEPSVLGEALNEVFIPLLRQQFPEIVDFWLPPEGCSYRIAVVSMKKAYAGHAKRVMMGVWSYLRQFMYTKWVIVVDDDIDARDWTDVMWAISTRMDPARDITVIENTPHRLPGLRLAGERPGLEDRPRRHRQVAAGDPTASGAANWAWTRPPSRRSRRCGRSSACRATDGPSTDLAGSREARPTARAHGENTMDATASAHAAALWVGLHLILLLVLSLLVVRQRRTHGVVLGDAAIPELTQAVRAFGNATEYVPAGLVAIAVLAMVGAAPMVVHVTGLVLLTGRVLHAIGLSRSGGGLGPALGRGDPHLARLHPGRRGPGVLRDPPELAP